MSPPGSEIKKCHNSLSSKALATWTCWIKLHNFCVDNLTNLAARVRVIKWSHLPLFLKFQASVTMAAYGRNWWIVKLRLGEPKVTCITWTLTKFLTVLWCFLCLDWPKLWDLLGVVSLKFSFYCFSTLAMTSPTLACVRVCNTHQM